MESFLDSAFSRSHSDPMTKDEHWLLNEKYNGVETPEFKADNARLASGEPLAYVIGHVPFLNATIYLDSHPLIPRPETEFWTEQAITSIQITERPVRILDLCAGSGAIGVAVAKEIEDAHVTFAEIDKAHLSTIAKNLAMNDIPCTQYQVFGSDLFSSIKGKFDYILSNPPYIDPILDRVDASVKAYEPSTALYGGREGIEIISTIIRTTVEYLLPNGQLWLEHEPEQTKKIQGLALEYGFTPVTHNDQYGVDRYSVLTLTP